MGADEQKFATVSPSEQYTCKSKCLDSEIPTEESLIALDESSLPFPLEHIPATVHSLKECGEYQIRALLDKDPALLTAEDEDAMDDGFVICDLNVVRKKLQVWRLMFPRVKPFFALKVRIAPNRSLESMPRNTELLSTPRIDPPNTTHNSHRICSVIQIPWWLLFSDSLVPQALIALRYPN
jgi:hypothetical protein